MGEHAEQCDPLARGVVAFRSAGTDGLDDDLRDRLDLAELLLGGGGAERRELVAVERGPVRVGGGQPRAHVRLGLGEDLGLRPAGFDDNHRDAPRSELEAQRV